MVKIKSESDRYVELKEKDYLLLLENTMMLEALKIAGMGHQFARSLPFLRMAHSDSARSYP